MREFRSLGNNRNVFPASQFATPRILFSKVQHLNQQKPRSDKEENMKAKNSINAIYAGLAMILGVFIAGELFGADMMRKSNPFKGPKARYRHGDSFPRGK
jgi:hypothetical protein